MANTAQAISTAKAELDKLKASGGPADLGQRNRLIDVINKARRRQSSELLDSGVGDVSGTGPFVPTPIPGDLEGTARDSDQYEEGAGLIEQQETQQRQGLIGQRGTIKQSYGRSRQDTINAFQDALDAINTQARGVGITTKAGSASRQLYDASGQLSGIGQGVAAEAIAPITQATAKLFRDKGIATTRLNQDERAELDAVSEQIDALPLASKQARIALKDQIVNGIIKAAKERQDDELKVFKANRQLHKDLLADIRRADKDALAAEKADPNSRVNIIETRTKQEAKGRTYLSDMQQVQQAKANGQDVFKIGDDFFTLSAKEQADLNKKRTASRVGVSATTSQADKNQYNLDFMRILDQTLAEGDITGDQLTREEAARILAQNYPFVKYDDILADIYKTHKSSTEIDEDKKRPTIEWPG